MKFVGSTLFIFCLWVGHSIATVNDVIKQFPNELSNLLNDVSNVPQPNIFQDNDPYYNKILFNFTSSFRMEVDKESFSSKNFDDSIIVISFKLNMPEVTPKGYLQFTRGSDSYKADFTSISLGILKSKVDVYYDLKAKNFMFKNDLINSVDYVTGFSWGENHPSVVDRDATENKLDTFLNDVFSQDLNQNLHRFISKKVPSVVEKLDSWYRKN